MIFSAGLVGNQHSSPAPERLEVHASQLFSTAAFYSLCRLSRRIASQWPEESESGIHTYSDPNPYLFPALLTVP